MQKKSRVLALFALCGFFVFLDQTAKYLARSPSNAAHSLWKPWIGWELYQNHGIAFSIPFPNWLIVSVTPVILLLLVLWLISSTAKRSIYFHAGLSLIISGALSNYIDRILFGTTTDYLRLFTSVINLADVMIVAGVGFLLWDGAKI